MGGEYNPLMLINLQESDKIQNELILSLKKIFDKDLLFELQRINDPLIDKYENKFIFYEKQPFIKLYSGSPPEQS